MKIVFKRCCGVDIRQDTVMACGLIQEEEDAKKDTRTFAFSPEGLLCLLDWISAWKLTHVAINETGGRWKPTFYLFEGSATIFLIDPDRLKSLLGQPQGIPDCEWIADLLSCGLLKGNPISSEPIADLRDLLRYRKSLAEEREVEFRRLRKLLETANFTLPPQSLEDEGFSIRAVLEALFAGTAEPRVLSDLARSRLRDQVPVLRQVLQESIFPPYHRFMLEQVLTHLDLLHEAFRQASQEVKNRIVPFGVATKGLETAPKEGPWREASFPPGGNGAIGMPGLKDSRSREKESYLHRRNRLQKERPVLLQL